MHYYEMLEIGNVSWHQTHVVFGHIFALVFAIELNSNTYRFTVFPLIFVTYMYASRVRDEIITTAMYGLEIRPFHNGCPETSVQTGK